jgi:hypothetical protein
MLIFAGDKPVQPAPRGLLRALCRHRRCLVGSGQKIFIWPRGGGGGFFLRAPLLCMGLSRKKNKSVPQRSPGKARLVFSQQKPLPIATVGPRPSQVVRSTTPGMPCSELQGYNAPRPGLRMPLRLRFCRQSGYVPTPPPSRRFPDFPVPPPVCSSGRGFY